MEIKFSDIRFFFRIAGISEILPLILFFFRKQKKSKELGLVFTFQLVGFLSEISFAIIQKKISINNASIILDVFTIIATLILAYLFQTILSGIKFRKVVFYSAIALVAYIIIKFFTSNSDVSFNSINVAVLAILVIIWSIIFFYEQLTKPTDSNQLFLYSSPPFWIVTAYLIYFAGTFFLFIYSQHRNLDPGTEFFIQYSLINGVFRLIKNILLSVAMFTKPENNNTLPGKSRSQTY